MVVRVHLFMTGCIQHTSSFVVDRNTDAKQILPYHKKKKEKNPLLRTQLGEGEEMTVKEPKSYLAAGQARNATVCSIPGL